MRRIVFWQFSIKVRLLYSASVTLLCLSLLCSITVTVPFLFSSVLAGRRRRLAYTSIIIFEYELFRILDFWYQFIICSFEKTQYIPHNSLSTFENWFHHQSLYCIMFNLLCVKFCYWFTHLVNFSFLGKNIFLSHCALFPREIMKYFTTFLKSNSLSHSNWTLHHSLLIFSGKCLH